MLKFIRGKGQQPTVERQRLQKELFAYRKTAQHGFPHKPSAIAFDPKSKLMAIGTQTGAIKVFGRPGVEFYGQHTMQSNSAADLNVQLLEWVHGSGNILSLTAANQLILWEPAGSTLVPLKTLSFDGKLKKISSLCCSYANDIVWIGTEGGNIYQLDLSDFSVKETVIYHDVILEQIPPSYKLNPGAIESIKQLPQSWNQLLIAYNRGLCVLWDTETSSVINSYIAPGHGQSVGLFINTLGTEFTWYHADGSFATWYISGSNSSSNLDYVPYGPDPCKSINRLFRGTRSSKDVVIFSGGMPRSAYGDHNCVSVHVANGSKTCLDFTSKVIDFFVTYKENSDVAEVLVVLLEEELCAYDLTNPKLPVVKAPYLHSVHASAVTCNQLVSQVTQEVFDKIYQAGEKQDSECSHIEWPINGGVLPETGDESGDDQNKTYEIMLTGHEDGSVKFWNCTEVVMTPIYYLKTSNLFGNENPSDSHTEPSEQLDELEPPFRKAGLFDPYSDDPRLAVKKISLCPKTGRVIIGGTAGQIIIANFDDESDERASIKFVTVNLVSDRDGFVWKGHDQLNLRANLIAENGEYVGDHGLEINGILQVLPPASITCLALQTDWNLVSAGTAHGLVLFDFKHFQTVFYRCTLNPHDLTGAGEQLSRRKSFKKSLRESFRKLRKGRSTRNNPNQPATTLDARPVERQVEARSPDDGMGSMVRCLVFAKTYITNVHTTSATLWSATNSSSVLIFLLNLPPPQANDQPDSPPRYVTAKLAKEIQLKHRAPVVGIAVFDQTGVPLEFQSSGTPPHRVLIASEEQFKVFSLPQLKPITKYKLTAHEGARVRRLAFATFSCRMTPEILQGSPTRSIKLEQAVEQNAQFYNGDMVPESARIYQEIDLLCLTNLGDILVLSIPELKRQINAAAVRREDINGISSLCFTNQGEALYMMSSSELQRVSLASSKAVTPIGVVSMEQLEDKSANRNSVPEQDGVDISSSESINRPIKKGSLELNGPQLTNGTEGSPNRGNETISSSTGDITVDSVRDHLNTTTTTLCSTTTEETVGRLSVLNTQTSQSITNANVKDITNLYIPNPADLLSHCNTTETNTNSVVIKSVITTISHEKTNGEHETTSTTKTSTHEESQF